MYSPKKIETSWIKASDIRPFNVNRIKAVVDKRYCAKQTTIAVVISKEGKEYIGSNWCEEPQEECPRKDLPSGVGYCLCKEICKQPAHAEVDACKKAGNDANGADLYLIGHTYACQDCQSVMEYYGIERLFVVEDD